MLTSIPVDQFDPARHSHPIASDVIMPGDIVVLTPEEQRVSARPYIAGRRVPDLPEQIGIAVHKHDIVEPAVMVACRIENSYIIRIWVWAEDSEGQR